MTISKLKYRTLKDEGKIHIYVHMFLCVNMLYVYIYVFFLLLIILFLYEIIGLAFNYTCHNRQYTYELCFFE